MHKWLAYISLFLLLMGASCTHTSNNVSQYHQQLSQIDNEIAVMLDTVKQHHSVTELITTGFHELGFKLMADSLKLDGSDARKLYYGRLCMDFGDFEMGLNMINGISTPALSFEKAYYKLTAALNSMDTLVSRPLLDSLYKCLKNDYTKEHEAAYLCMKGYHHHNARDLEGAIQIYTCALDTMEKYGINNLELLRLYRRMANSYNDLYRSTMTDTALFNRALHFYTLEKENTIKQLGSNAFRLISNEMTTALLDYKHTRYIMEDVFKRLYVTEDSDYVVAINPVYFSVAVEILSYMIPCDDKNGCLSRISKMQYQSFRLVNQQVVGALSSYKGQDIVTYNLSRSFLRGLFYHCYEPHHSQTTVPPSDLLLWSSLSKHNAIDMLPTVRNIYGDDAQMATRSWVMLHELKLLGIHRNNTYLATIGGEMLCRLEHSFRPILNCLNKKAFNHSQMDAITKYCKQHDAAFLDYSFNDTVLQVVKIDSSGISEWHQSFTRSEATSLFIDAPNALKRLMDKDSVAQYEVFGNHVYNQLRLNECPQHNLIICADREMEGLSFAALTTTVKGSKRWSDLDYLGDKKKIRYVSNAYALLDDPEIVKGGKIDIMYSSKDNEVLPENKDLIKVLTQEYSADANQRNIGAYDIMHLISHTIPDQHSVKFYLDNDTISTTSDGLIANA